MSKRWMQSNVSAQYIGDRCQRLEEDGWTVHTILPMRGINDSLRPSIVVDGAIIVCFRDKVGLMGGVPR